MLVPWPEVQHYIPTFTVERSMFNHERHERYLFSHMENFVMVGLGINFESQDLSFEVIDGFVLLVHSLLY